LSKEHKTKIKYLFSDKKINGEKVAEDNR